MKNPPVKIKNMPETIQRLRDLKPEIQRKMDSAVEAAQGMTSLKAVEKLRKELNKDFRPYFTRYLDVLEWLSEVKLEVSKTFDECVRDLYDGADLEMSKQEEIQRKRATEKKTEEVEQYFKGYAVKMKATYLSFEKSGIHVTLEEKLTSLQGKCRAYIDSMTYSQRGTNSGGKFALLGDIMAPGGWWQRLRSWVKSKR